MTALPAGRFVVTLAIGALTALGGCAGGDDPARLREQADEALARWADAVAAAGGLSAVVPVGELTRQVGDWEVEVGDNNKSALFAGLVEAAAALPAESPPDGEVEWPDGTTATVPLISAVQAVAAIRAGATETCNECTAMRITGARLTTGEIDTTHGPATAPVWELTIEGTAVLLNHLAVANPITVEPPDPSDRLFGVWLEGAQGTVDGRELTVAFAGAPRPGDQPCGEDYTAEAVESDLAVVVVVFRHPNGAPGGCTGVGARRTTTVTLAAPLDDRAVLQVYDGTPVRIVLGP